MKGYIISIGNLKKLLNNVRFLDYWKLPVQDHLIDHLIENQKKGVLKISIKQAVVVIEEEKK